ncbi:hypothetical protein DPMN_008701 [Dreissena polymorpha]|uniref:Uncharacterized protein n=1 Tax=Dreissena polymorpha TaxID=45954 RepID=A0A9D4RZE9_DREPO|nr:hypothetical protein DPMN_008701 [Dreissena polymorpha]
MEEGKRLRRKRRWGCLGRKHLEGWGNVWNSCLGRKIGAILLCNPHETWITANARPNLRPTFIKTEVLSDMMALVPMYPFNMYYKIQKPGNSNIYKFEGSKTGINLQRVYTADDSAQCGITLSKEYTYILSGSTAGINFEGVYTAENSAMCGVAGLERGRHILSGFIDHIRGQLNLNLFVSWFERFPLSMQARTLLRRIRKEKVFDERTDSLLEAEWNIFHNWIAVFRAEYKRMSRWHIWVELFTDVQHTLSLWKRTL